MERRTEHPYLTVGQAAHELGIAPRTVIARISAGRITAQKHGTGKTSAYIIPRTEIDRIKANTTAA
jgi:excisionase family DNA binding protein